MGRKKKALPQQLIKKPIFNGTLEESIAENIEQARELIEERDFEDAMGSNQLFVSNKVIQPLNYFLATKFQSRTAEEYALAFNGFLEIINIINEKMTYTPTVNTFCRYLGISKTRFDEISSLNNETGDVCRQIKDFLAETLMQNMLGNRVGAVQGIFIAKANLGMRDTEAPKLNIVTINNEPQSLDEILENFNKIGH